jgi:hypothetical protein
VKLIIVCEKFFLKCIIAASAFELEKAMTGKKLYKKVLEQEKKGRSKKRRERR